MMAAFAQMESELASERTKKGLEAARAEGKQIGALPKRQVWEEKEPEKAAAILKDCADPKISMNAIAKKYGITNATLRNNWGAELQSAGKMKRK
ncbi:recombinase family protein [Roseibium sp. SCPC15]|uniref:recombinase family protein n=1 Tax=Roseibium sp. SCP15 TaxID=3141376 RepID=UPI00333B6792